MRVLQFQFAALAASLLCAQTALCEEIGDRLNIGVETVRTYVKSICLKMHVRSRLEAVAKHCTQTF